MNKTIKFRICVRGHRGDEWWEEYEKFAEGQMGNTTGWGRQPDFEGDIDDWGRRLVAWFNKYEPEAHHRVYVKHEIVPTPKEPQ